MTEMLRLRGPETVLEIGTGSGYQTAILARLTRHVYSAELEPDLASGVRERLEQPRHRQRHPRRRRRPGDLPRPGALRRHSLRRRPRDPPGTLIAQLAEGGRCVIPVGTSDYQYLWLIERRDGRVTRTRHEAVRFVPMRQ